LETALSLSDPVEQRVTIVADLSQFRMRNIDYEVIQAAVSILQQNYPETMQVALVCEAPFIFNACYAIIKPWLDPVTASKVAFISGKQLFGYLDESEVFAEALGFSLK
jgi:hypothetical protein